MIFAIRDERNGGIHCEHRVAVQTHKLTALDFPMDDHGIFVRNFCVFENGTIKIGGGFGLPIKPQARVYLICHF